MIKALAFIAVVHLISLKTFSADQCKLMKYAGASEWQPISYIDDAGLYRGLVYDIMLAVTKPLNIELTSVPERPWTRVIDDLQKGKIDAVFGAYYNEDRAKKFIYSTSLLQDKIKLFVRHDNQFNFSKLKDLLGKTGVRPFGGSYGDIFDSFDKQHLNLDRIKKAELMLKMVQAGRVDFMVLAELDGMYEVKKAGLLKQVIPLQQDVAKLDIYVLFSKSSDCINKIPNINQSIKEIKDQGITEKLYLGYLQSIQ